MRAGVPLVAIIAVAVLAAAARSDDWPQWRGPNRDGKSAETGLLKVWPPEGPKLLWVAEGLGAGWSSPAIAKGLLFVTGVHGKSEFLYAYDLDGSLQWKEEIGPAWTKTHPGARYTPTVGGSDLYVLTSGGVVSCYEAKTGAKWWSVDIGDRFKSSPPSWGFAEGLLLDGERLICTPGGKDASLVALDKMTGQTAWTTKGLGDADAYCAPILVAQGNARLIVTLTAQNVVGIRADTGACLWRYPFRNLYGDHCITPIFHEGRLYVAAGYGCGGTLLKLATDGKSVTREWADTRLDCLHGGVVLVNGYLYGSGDRNPRWVCLDFGTGEAKYEERGIGGGCVTYADGMLYCYSEDGVVAIVPASPDRYEVASAFRIAKGTGEHWAHPVISGGRLYIRHGDALMAYDLKQREQGTGSSEPAKGEPAKTQGESATKGPGGRK